MKRTISNIFCGVAFLLATLAGTSCNDWTKNEKIAVEDPVFGEGDPELYARYLASLRAYKSATTGGRSSGSTIRTSNPPAGAAFSPTCPTAWMSWR